MSVAIECKHCRITISAADEDELVANVQAHTRTHEHPHEPTREHILARLQRQQRG